MEKGRWRVGIIERDQRLYLRARDRLTGKTRERVATSLKRKEAVREAASWEADLNEHGSVDDLRFSIAFERFATEYAIHRRAGTQQEFRGASSWFQTLIGDPKLGTINESMIADFTRRFAAGQQKSGKTSDSKKSKPRAGATVAKTLRHLRVFLRWAHRNKLMTRLPHIEMPPTPNKAGGRSLTTEEFERMREALVLCRPNDPAPWQFLLNGLWCSGLRLGEALNLSWEESAPVAIVDMHKPRPFIRIDGGSQKGGKTTETPCVPELVALLQSVPRADRTGYVFKLPTRLLENVSKVLSEAGRKACVGTGNGTTATAHDLRRSFAARWAKRLPAQALQQLMRHSNIATTLTFYVNGDVGLADAIWNRSGEFSGELPPSPPSSDAPETAENTEKTEWGRRDLNPEPTDYES